MMNDPLTMIQIAQQNAQGANKLVSFFEKGGIFIYPILLCSIAAVAIIIYQTLLLRRSKILPAKLVDSMNEYVYRGDEDAVSQLNEYRKTEPSVLQRLCDVVLQRHDRKDVEIQEAVQASAREEIVKLQTGVPFLEVIVAIAPLLGLLGTATGLFAVFEGVGGGDDKYQEMAIGISEALITTVCGLAVAVPAVIALGYFNRKIERYAARLEVVMDQFVGAFSKGRGVATSKESEVK